MADLQLSPAVSLAWQIAASEALRSGHAFIEPEHLLVGACSLDKALSSKSSVPPEAASAVRDEWESFASSLRAVDCDPVSLRRKFRIAVAGRPQSAGDAKISRSARARQVFLRAADIARDHEAPAIGLAQFSFAVLEDPNVIARLQDEDISPEKLRTSIAMHLGSASTFAAVPNRVTVTNSPITGTLAEPTHDSSVTESLDATVAVTRTNANDADRRLALFYELPWQCGSSSNIDDLLQKLLEQLIRVIPAAQRGNVLTLDAKTGELLLKAHLPAGAPAVSLTSVQEAMEKREAFIWKKTETLTSSQEEHGASSGIYAPLVWNERVFGVITLDNHGAEAFNRDDLTLVVSVAHQAAMAVANRQLTDELQKNNDLLERLMTSFSPKIRSRLLEKASHGRLRPGGERSEVTILCSDIRGFTRMSAGMDTEAIVDLLNEYFSSLSKAIFRHDGAIDKFLGDGILAVFGSPEPDPQHSTKAVAAAMEMQQAMREVNRVRELRNQPLCEIGIGVHCGEVLHGFIGGAERMEFTVIGDTVNRASRYCAGAAPGQVLISAELHQRVWKLVDAEPAQIPTKHEGNFLGYLVKQMKPPR